MNVLIVYGTTDGMTARIAERMARTARTAGHTVRLAEAAGARDVQPAAYDVVLVGASLHAGGFQRAVKRFVRRHVAALHTRPSAFFSVCLAIASKSDDERAEARRIASAFPAGLGWRPTAVEVIAGALMFSRYGILRRFALTRIARKELGGDIDVTRDHVYTDWDAVDRFVLAFTRAAAERLPIESASSASP
jgi:menaquinone-dependent protoporphyrinogen oxidase